MERMREIWATDKRAVQQEFKKDQDLNSTFEIHM